ncbi:hypothetical protein FB451DRAFT_1274659 [Mycena latifolia]|nr:hypothetical protein FB451DRAFT_1274659 [Mycena latifolia]
MARSHSPPAKRVKLESPRTPPPVVKSEAEEPSLKPEEEVEEEGEEEEEDRCSICLQGVVDRTVVPLCAHEFCFDCLIVWTGQSRRCPLCSQGIGAFVIHKIRSRYDYQKHYLNPLPTSPVPAQPLLPRQNRVPRRRPRDREWGRRERTESDEADKLDRSIAKRRWIYEHDLYAKHVASNSYTRYRPYPTPAQFAASPDLISRTTMFLRRELQVWVNLDVEFLTTFIISIMKAIDIRSESAVKLLSEFLDLDAPYVEGGRHVNAEHFAHEVYSYVRSPYKDLFVYDSVVQYEVTAEVPALPEEPRRRWREASRSPSPAASQRDHRAERTRRARSRSRSISGSCSGRQHTSSRDRQLDEHISRGSGTRQSRNDSRHRETNEHRGPGDNSDISVQPAGLVLPDPTGTLSAMHSAAATETTDILDPKGKTRSILGLGPTTPEAEISTTAVPQNERAMEDAPPQLAPRKPPRVRNRSLFESVQAHLAISSRKDSREARALHDSALASTSKLPSGLKTTQIDSPPSPPSLLARLSDPDTGHSISRQKTDSGLSPSPVLTGAPINTLFSSSVRPIPIDAELSQSCTTKTTLSPPEIMARMRTRLANLPAANDVEQMSLASGVEAAQPPLSPPSLSLSSGSRQDGNSDISTSPGHIGGSSRAVDPRRRTELLGRLEAEKQQAADTGALHTVFTAAAAAPLDRISQGESITFPPDKVFPPSVDAAEVRLRRQAQLRVRLAAEKRAHASG